MDGLEMTFIASGRPFGRRFDFQLAESISHLAVVTYCWWSSRASDCRLHDRCPISICGLEFNSHQLLYNLDYIFHCILFTVCAMIFSGLHWLTQ